MLAAQPEQRGVPVQRGLPFARRAPLPVDLALREGLFGLRVGDLAAEVVERLEFLAPAVAHRFDERGIAVGDEVEERLRRRPFLALEIEREGGRERDQRRRDAQAARRSQLHQPLAAGAIADLVVVLRADHEPATGKMRGGSCLRHTRS